MMPARPDIDAIVAEIVESGGAIIRGFVSRNDLAREMQAAIDAGRMCAFVPTLKTLREFLNTRGFILAMNEVASRLNNCRVLVEPNAYGSKHVFAVASADQ